MAEQHLRVIAKTDVPFQRFRKKVRIIFIVRPRREDSIIREIGKLFGKSGKITVDLEEQIVIHDHIRANDGNKIVVA